MSASDSYDVVAERLGFPGSQKLRRILEYVMPPDAARMVEQLPATVSEVAEKTGYDIAYVRQELDSLFRKGVIFPRGDYSKREYYRSPRNIVQMHDASQTSPEIDFDKDRAFFQMWHDFISTEAYPKLARARHALGAASSRVVPAYSSIKDLPDILPYENYREMLMAQPQIAVVPCPCRTRTASVDLACSHTNEREHWHCLQFGRGADYTVARGAGKVLTADEALALMEGMEEDGLIHIWGNASTVAGANTSCNCCTDCCGGYVSLREAGLPTTSYWQKSRFAAHMDSVDDCNGCQNCVDRCQFDAIEMVKVAGAKKMKASVDEEKCWGCGLCVIKCEPAALKMKAVRPAEHIPVINLTDNPGRHGDAAVGSW